MQKIASFIIKHKTFKFDIFLIFLTLLYYVLFINRGISMMDEGYILHMSDRIFYGQIPFRDFLSQYSPGLLYTIFVFFKLFNASILTARVVSLFFCLGILVLIFLLLNELKIYKKHIHFLSFLSIISFGFPLINIATISWPIVFLSLILVWLIFKIKDKVNNIKLISIGLCLFIILFFKQNFGLYYSILVLLLFTLKKEKFNLKIQKIILTFVPFVLLTFFWFLVIFINNYNNFKIFLNFSVNYATKFVFSYPPISMIFEPLGIFKLTPYYLPLIFLIILIYFKYKNLVEQKIFIFSLFMLVGFLGLIYPGSDLLHLYPFYGAILVALLLFLTNSKRDKFAYFLIVINVLMGFYLTLFREYLRYSPPYRLENTAIKIPRAENILIQYDKAPAIMHAYNFIQENTSKNDYIFVYPASPMLYFLLDRKNPSEDSLYIPPYNMLDENSVLKEVEDKRVRYIVTDGKYDNPTLLSKFIQKQKKVFSEEQIRIFLITK